MKILHVFNLAGVGSTIAHELNLMDIETKVLSRYNLDVFGFGCLYPNEHIYVTGGVKRFLLTLVKEARKHDIIHIHTWDMGLKILPKIFPKKKYVLHYHGGEIRDNFTEDRYNTMLKADFVAVATPFLRASFPVKFKLPTTYMENPVDRFHFSRVYDYKEDTALFIRQHFNYETPAETEAEKLAKNLGLDLFKLNREEYKVSYSIFPRFLEQYEYFLDYKHGRVIRDRELQEGKQSQILEDLSLTGLQQLGLGGKTIHKTFGKLTELNYNHKSDVVAKKWVDVYENLY